MIGTDTCPIREVTGMYQGGDIIIIIGCGESTGT